MTNQQIYNALRAGGLSRAGALGVMGNFMAESRMNPKNVEDRSKIDDEVYTEMVDTNPNYDFATDYGRQYGYGYAQWTEKSRKLSLRKFANANGVSIGDAAMQIQFCLYELKTGGGALYDTLCHSDDIDLCSDMVCSQYEMPEVNNFIPRRNYAHQFAEECTDDCKDESEDESEPVPDPFFQWQIANIQTAMKHDGYWDTIDGHKSKLFFQKLKEYISDMEVC